jgi:secreted trypsin-like serine protease
MLQYFFYPLFFLILLTRCSDSSNNPSAQETQPLDNCGTNNIICGHKIGELSSWQKYAVFLETSRKDGEHSPKVGACTGVLIHPKVVLTAAHCFRDEAGQVIANSAVAVFSAKPLANGGADLNNPQKYRESAQIIVHEEYRPQNEILAQSNTEKLAELHAQPTNDLALVVLSQKAPPNLSVVARLSDRASDGQLVEMNSSDQILYFLGYGYESSHQIGQRSLQVMGQSLDHTVSPIFPQSKEFIWNQKVGGKICHGDSGGPIYSRDGTDVILVGISQLVFAKNGNTNLCNEFGVATSVAAYRKWIKEKLNVLD